MPDRPLHPSALDHAPKPGRTTLARTTTGTRTTLSLGTLLGFVDLDTGDGEVTTGTVRRAQVDVAGATMHLPALPGTYVVGFPVWVESDGTGAPKRVTGPAAEPATTSGGPSPQLVTHMPSLIIDTNARQAVERAEESISTAQDNVADTAYLIDQLRGRVGRVVATTTHVEDGFTWTTLGNGRVRFTSTGEGHTWDFGAGVDPQTSDQGTVTVTYPSAGDKEVEHEVAGPYSYEYVTITLTPEDMAAPGEGYGWRPATLADLSAAGGPLDPAVLEEAWEQTYSAGWFVATEGFIGPQAIIDGGVQARHMDVVSQDAAGRGVAIDGDGVTVTDPVTGSVHLSYDGLVALDPQGRVLVRVDGNDNLLTGELRTSQPGQPGLILEPVTDTGYPGLWFSMDGEKSGINPLLFIDADGWVHLRGQRAEGSMTSVRGFRVTGGVEVVTGPLKGRLRYGQRHSGAGSRFGAYTTSKDATRGTLTHGAGTISVNVGATRDTPANVAGESLVIPESGVYTITRTATFSTRPSASRAFIEISPDDSRQWRQSMGGEDYATVTSGPQSFSAGVAINFPSLFEGSGNYAVTGTITVLRHE